MSTPCAELSGLAAEPLAGTAADRVRAWLCVEVRGGWARDVLDAPELPARLRAHLDATLAAAPKTRLLFLKRDLREGPLQVFVARLEADGPILARLEVPDLESLAGVDLAAWCSGPLPAELLDREPLFAVCTHGKRDRCCAERGMPVVRALAEVAPERTWQCSHLGGHRMAPNLLALPSGYCYGRVEPARAGAIVRAERAGEIYDLSRVRGRTYYPRAAQAADVLVRLALGERGHAAVHLIGCELREGDRTHVELSSGGARHTRLLEEREWGAPVLIGSCGDTELSPVSGWSEVGLGGN